MSDEISAKVENFFAEFPIRKFDKDYILVHAGNEPPSIFYLVKGEVRQYDISKQGDEIVVNVFKPKAFFPMSWAINKTPNQYFFAAASPTIVRQTPADDIVDFLKSNPDVVFDLLSRLYRGVDGLLRRSAHLMGSDAYTRLLFELLVEGRRFGHPVGKDQVTVSLSEEELARRAGLSRETVSRQLSRINQENLVRVTPEGLVIKSLLNLEQSLGNDL